LDYYLGLGWFDYLGIDPIKRLLRSKREVSVPDWYNNLSFGD